MTFDEWYAPLDDEPPWNGTRIKQLARDAWNAAYAEAGRVAVATIDRHPLPQTAEMERRVAAFESRLRRLEGEHAIHYPQAGPLAP